MTGEPTPIPGRGTQIVEPTLVPSTGTDAQMAEVVETAVVANPGTDVVQRTESQNTKSSGDSTKKTSQSDVTTKVKVSGTLSQATRLNLLAGADHDDIDDASDHGHGHGPKPDSIVTAFASAIINFLLMFGLCAAYGLIMFPDSWHAQHRGLAVKMNLASAMGVGISLALFSGVRVAIGGPDLNPVVFIGMMIESISAKVSEKYGLDLPSSSRRLLDVCSAVFEPEAPADRRLASSGSSGGSAVEFCTGDHYIAHDVACNDYHAELIATTIITVVISSAIFGTIFYLLGKFRLTRLVSYLPTNIMEAFLSCVGYKVFKYALKFCKYEPMQFLPAACIGVPLYFIKAMHLGNPAVVIPSMLFIPLGMFYGILYASGSDVDQAREDGWMFDYMENAPFWDTYTKSLGGDAGFMGRVNWDAWASTLAHQPIAIIVVLMDCLLKLHSTESKLPVKTKKDPEMELYGKSNIITVLTGGTVGYMQLKFNVINYGVLGNVTDRRGGMIYACLIGVCWWGSTSIFNFMPRFFLSALLFFAGSGFVVENLWGSRKYLSTNEWLQILLIVAIFILSESLLIAVVIGSVIIGASFILKYASVPTYHGPIMGGEIATTQRRNLLQQACIHHITNSHLMVFHLKGFIFFASAQNLLEHIEERVKEFEEGLAEHKRVKYIIFEASQLDSMDSSATKAFTKFAMTEKKKHNINVWWCSLSDDLKAALRLAGAIHSKKECYENLSEAADKIETEVTDYVRSLQAAWVGLHPRFRMVQDFLRSQERFEPFREVLTTDSSRVGCPWKYCGRLKMKKYETLIWEPGEYSRELFLVHSGKIGLFSTLTEAGEGHEWGALVATYQHGWFLNTHSFFQEATQYYAVALEDGYCVTWNEFQWAKLKRERPGMAAGILAAAMRQSHTGTEMIKLHHHQFKDSDSKHSEQAGSKHSEQAEGAHSIVPPELQRSLEGLDWAKELYRKGFYAKADGGGSISPRNSTDSPRNSTGNGPMPSIEQGLRKMPTVPKRVVDDLETAWLSYVQWFDNGKIPINRVREALMYAGIFDVLIDGRAEVEEVSKDKFMSIGVSGFMCKFNSDQIKECEDLFEDVDADGNGVLDAEEVVTLFQDVLKGQISVEEVEGMLALWGGDDSATAEYCVDKNGFIGLMARFVKRYEVYFNILCGISEVMGTDLDSLALNDTDAGATTRQISGCSFTSPRRQISSDGKKAEMSVTDVQTCLREHRGKDNAGPSATQLTMQMLQDNAGMKAEEAEELLWVTDCYGLGNSTTLDYKMVAAAIFTNHTQPKQLPPLPVLLNEGDIRIYNEPEANSKLVVDSRSFKDTMELKYQMDLTEMHNKEMLKYKCKHDGEPEVVNGVEDPIYRLARLLEAPVEYPAAAELGTYKEMVNEMLENPNSSDTASRISVFVGILIVVNVLALIIQPIVSPEEDATDTEEIVWFCVEAGFTAIFGMELIARFWASDAFGETRLHFIKSPLNICDFIATLPFFIDLIVEVITKGNPDHSLFQLLRVTRFIRLARVMRLGRLAKRSAAFAPMAVIFVVIWGTYMKGSLTK